MPNTWLEAWWERRREEQRQKNNPPDPGVPAWRNTCTNQETIHPWTAVGGAIERLKKVYDLNRLRRSIMKALGVNF